MRKLALLLLPLALLAGACLGGGGGDGEPDGDEGAQVGQDATDEAPEVTATPESAEADLDGGGGGAGSLLGGSFNPLQLFSNISSGGQPSSGAADPDLKGALLAASDLPSGYTPFGEFSFSLPTEYGNADMVANMFMSGDVLSGELGAMVMSAAIAAPPDALKELGDFSALSDISQSDLDQMTAAGGALGVQFRDVRLLDASGLGEGGAGIHMVLDMGELLSSFGGEGQANPFASGMAMDMYMFGKGDTLLMLMVSSADQSPDFDAKALAEKMDAKV